jgi:sugar phosphate isomerase/epimerase
MLIGAMNHPGRPVVGEIEWMAAMGLDFIDLTLEPPQAAVWAVDVDTVRGALEQHGLQIVGHTAYYLPLASPFDSIRRAAVEEASRCLALFAQLGVAWMNLHPDRHAPLHDRGYVINRNLQSLRELLSTAQDEGVGIMIENLPGELSTIEGLDPLLKPLPEVGLHLDIGHANLLLPRNTADELIPRACARCISTITKAAPRICICRLARVPSIGSVTSAH